MRDQISPFGRIGRQWGRMSGGTAPPAFTPASIFTGTDEGFWADVTPSRLWQDVARTTPVTAAGQAVASWELTTRTGVIYAEQATGSSAPVYQVDTDNRAYLDFSGNKWMRTASIAPGSVDKAQWFAAFNMVGGTTFKILFETSANSETNNGNVGCVLFSNANGVILRSVSRGTATVTTIGPQVPPTDRKLVAAGIADIAAPSNILRENGAQTGVLTTSQGTGNYTTQPVNIGSRNGGSSHFNGRFYGMILRYGPNLTTQQITDTEAWMASLINP